MITVDALVIHVNDEYSFILDKTGLVCYTILQYFSKSMNRIITPYIK